MPALRSDTNGAIRILTNKKKLEMSCFIACPAIDAQINLPKPQTPDNQQSRQQQ